RGLARKDPMEAVQGALVARRVMLERAHEAGSDGALGGTVRAVQQEHPVGTAFPDEVAQNAVDFRLYGLLPHQRIPRAVAGLGKRLIEQAKSLLGAPGPLDLLTLVEVEGVP